MGEPVRPDDLRTFVAVVEHRSFTAAAQELALPRPTVSRQIARLEEHLGLRLLHRTTRAVAPTAAGNDVLERARDALRALDHVAEAAEVAHGQPRGVLRIAAPPTMGPLLCRDLMLELLDEFPELSIEMDLVSRRVDLVAEGFDLALRMGPVADERLVATHLGHVALRVVAPSSITAAHPRDLAGVLLSFSGQDVTFEREQDRAVVSTNPRLRINDYGVLMRAAMRGLGAAMLPHPMCSPGALQGTGLSVILDDWSLPRQPVHLLRPAGRVMTPRVREFAGRLKARAHQEHWPLQRRPTP
ncbi:MAG: LysR family transcriptional regulator [Myxococcota bacterium]